MEHFKESVNDMTRKNFLMNPQGEINIGIHKIHTHAWR